MYSRTWRAFHGHNFKNTIRLIQGLVRTTYCNASKSAINTWLAQLVADIAGTGNLSIECLTNVALILLCTFDAFERLAR